MFQPAFGNAPAVRGHALSTKFVSRPERAPHSGEYAIYVRKRIDATIVR